MLNPIQYNTGQQFSPKYRRYKTRDYIAKLVTITSKVKKSTFLQIP